MPCDLCGKMLMSAGSLTNHIWSQHVGQTKPLVGSVCPTCGKDFGNPAGVGAHRKIVHNLDIVAEAYEAARKHGS